MAPKGKNKSDPPLLSIIFIAKYRAGPPKFILQYPPEPPHSQHSNPSSSSAANTNRAIRKDRSFVGSASVGTDEILTNSQRHGSYLSSAINATPRDTRNSLKWEDPATGQDTNQKLPKTPLTPSAVVKSFATSATVATTSDHSKEVPNNQSRAAAKRTWDFYGDWSKAELLQVLAPSSRAWSGKKFEVEVRYTLFVGCPIFERKEGGWVKEKIVRPRSVVPFLDLGDRADKKVASTPGGSFPSTPMADHPVESSSPLWDGKNMRTRAVSDPTGYVKTSFPLERSHSSTSTIQLESMLHMFNVVFVFRPEPGGKRFRADDIYQHVIQKFSKALRQLQKKDSYVWGECGKIIELSDVAKRSNMSYPSTWQAIHARSPLARAIKNVFDDISGSHIAHVSLSPDLQLSLQIPQKISTSIGPSPNGISQTGVYLTTFDSSSTQFAPSDPDSSSESFSQHSAMLLLMSATSLLQEVAAQPMPHPQMPNPIEIFIKHHSPTKTLLQLSKRINHLSLEHIMNVAQHLITWRRAVAISPLHGRNTYVVNPYADFKKLQHARRDFRRHFPTFTGVAGLTPLLAKLGTSEGGQMRPWSAIIPSKEDKRLYMDVLEWLMRGKWIMQLKTFGWVWISREIKAEVAREIREEDREATAASVLIDDTDQDLDDLDMAVEDEEVRRRTSSGSTNPPGVAIFSPPLRPVLQVPRPASEAGSTSTARTAFRIPLSKDFPYRAEVRKGSNHSKTGSGSGTGRRNHRTSSGSLQSSILLDAADVSSEEPDIQPSEFEPSAIISPYRANAIESRWIKHVAASIRDGDLATAWPRLLKYFDGKHALEEIAVREGLKGKHVALMLTKLASEEGVLKTVRHW